MADRIRRVRARAAGQPSRGLLAVLCTAQFVLVLDVAVVNVAYAMEHSSKPQTLAHALNDSPTGLASWILEKFRTWSDCGGDLDSVYDRADLLTNLTIYWATQTIGSSMRLSCETARSTSAAWGRVEVPTVMAMSGADMFPTPREWAERSYRVMSWTELPRGGHFLEWEVPDLVAADMRRFFRQFRCRLDRRPGRGAPGSGRNASVTCQSSAGDGRPAPTDTRAARPASVLAVVSADVRKAARRP